MVPPGRRRAAPLRRLHSEGAVSFVAPKGGAVMLHRQSRTAQAPPELRAKAGEDAKDTRLSGPLMETRWSNHGDCGHKYADVSTVVASPKRSEHWLTNRSSFHLRNMMAPTSAAVILWRNTRNASRHGKAPGVSPAPQMMSMTHE